MPGLAARSGVMTPRVTSASEFQRQWDSRINFELRDGCVPFAFHFPPTATIIDALISSAGTVATPGKQWAATEYAGKDHNIIEELRRLSPEERSTGSFALRHGELAEFDGPGQILHGNFPRTPLISSI